jgi:hypothetical protein
MIDFYGDCSQYLQRYYSNRTKKLDERHLDKRQDKTEHAINENKIKRLLFMKNAASVLLRMRHDFLTA